MPKQGNEHAEKATKKATKGEDPATEGGKSPGPAPMGGGDQKPNEAAGSKVEDVGDEGDPGLARKNVRRQQGGREPRP